MTLDETTSSLHISMVVEEDSGEYSCEARNKPGILAHSTVMITVKRKLALLYCPSFAILNVIHFSWHKLFFCILFKHAPTKFNFLFGKRRPLSDTLLDQNYIWSVQYTHDHSHCTEYRINSISPNVLMELSIPKHFSVATSNTPDEKEPATGFAVIPYIRGVTEPIKRILKTHNVKVVQKLFQTLGHIFAKPKDPVTKEQQTGKKLKMRISF